MTCKEAAQNAASRAATAERLAERTCERCGGHFGTRRSGKARFCSQACSVAFFNERKVEAKRSANLAKRGPCKGCGGQIPESRRSHAVYCSRACMTTTTRAAAYDGEAARDYNRRYLYGISSAEFDTLLAEQGGGCAICGTTEWPGRHNRPHVDHDHATGRVRGVLCTNCNNGLGNFNDDPDRLRAAITYLTTT